ncbi:MAG: outer membrane protein transport protein [Bacteroidetes bacterium]|nr:outer membrane protein transport protein [Bacteroidota bacterium]
MKKSHFLCFLLSMIYLHMSGGGFQLFYHGQRQTGMGNAGTGLALDGSSIFFNPGSLVFNRSNSVQLGTNAIFTNTSFLENPNSIYQANMDTLLFTPIHFYTVWQGKKKVQERKWSFGLGINNPFLGGSKWQDDWNGKFISQELAINTFFMQPTASYKLTQQIGLGVGFSLGFLSFLSRRAIEVDGQGGRVGSVRLSGTGNGLGLNAGLFIQANERLSLGLSYRTPIFVNLKKGSVRFDVPESLRDVFPDTQFNTDITLPGTLNIGIGYRPDEKWTLAFDINFTGWQTYDSLIFDFAIPIKQLQKHPEEKAYQKSASFRMGGEYEVSPKFKFRAGAYFDQSPVPDGFVSPELPDANRIGLSAGLGLNFAPNLEIDLSYLFEYTGERTSFLSQSQFGGTYRSGTNVYGLGIRYNF